MADPDGLSLAQAAELIKLRQTYGQEAAPSTEAQKLGMGPAAYTKLMEAQKAWEAADPNKRMLVSPMEVRLSQNAEKQKAFQDAGIPMDDAQFADHQRRKSDWEAKVESGKPMGFNDKDPDLSIQIASGKWIKTDEPAAAGPNAKLQKIMDDAMGGAKFPDRSFVIQ